MKDLGATHLLHASPMYNKPPQRGIVAHFKAIADATDLPIVVYNVPGRTGSNIEAKTTIELAGVKNIHAVNEASGNLGQISDVIRGRPKGFVVFSGDDELTLPIMALGGEGVVSVVSNAIPAPMSRLCELMEKGDFVAARDLHMKVLPFMRAAFIESNPLPIKAAMAMLGKMKNVLRLPLVPMSESNNEVVKSALKGAGAL
jgi:4-hydroxy-tetrahydrodipicolinate synthase